MSATSSPALRPAAATSPTDGVPVPTHELFAVITEYIEAGRLDGAERLLAHILAAAPNLPDALHTSGLIAFRRGKIPQAAVLMERAMAGGSARSAHFRNISEVYRLQVRLDEALTAARRAVALDPSDPLGPFNLAMVHYDRLEIGPCIAAARHAIDLRPKLPQAHMKLAQAMLLDGKLKEGWDEYEWRYQIPGAQPLMPPAFTARFVRPQWDGQKLEGRKLLLIGDQGFGDVMMFARYLPWVRERCPDVVMACSGEMHPVLTRMFPDLHLITRWDDCPDHAAFMPLSGLPRVAGTTLDSIPWNGPYLTADPERAALWQQRLDDKIAPGLRRIGIGWAGRPTHNNDINRTITLDTLAPIGEIPGIALVSLQKGPAAPQTKNWKGTAPLIDLTDQIEDFVDTAAIMHNLDMLVTVDTAIGHFAGSMGKPAWIMLPHAPDWRWLMAREDTPWYPSLRLFRHTEPRRWDLLVPRVAETLRQHVAQPDPMHSE